jgi:hypothetical protein
MSQSLPPLAHSEHGFMYVACDIPPGVTIDEFRRRRATKHGAGQFRRLRRQTTRRESP